METVKDLRKNYVVLAKEAIARAPSQTEEGVDLRPLADAIRTAIVDSGTSSLLAVETQTRLARLDSETAAASPRGTSSRGSSPGQRTPPAKKASPVAKSKVPAVRPKRPPWADETDTGSSAPGSARSTTSSGRVAPSRARGAAAAVGGPSRGRSPAGQEQSSSSAAREHSRSEPPKPGAGTGSAVAKPAAPGGEASGQT